MIVEITADRDLKEARALIERNGLFFESAFDSLVGYYEGGELLGVGARASNILKMIAVEPSHRGGPVLGELVTALVSQGMAAGFDSLFVFTKPQYASSFEALNFKLLASRPQVAMLEFGPGLGHWLDEHRALIRPGVNAAVVMNCNPFTLGHRYLIESAAREVDHLYVFVVRENRSIFPFSTRMRLVREGVQDLANVLVLDTGPYLVSAATFPSYFLKRDDPIARIQMELDVTLFAGKIAPYFGISRRFVGSEPLCEMTAAYNETMRRLLPEHGIALTEIERKQCDHGVISASRVRELVARNDVTQLKDFVSEHTYRYLLSGDAGPIQARARAELHPRTEQEHP